MTAMAEDLEQSEKADEQKAAEGFKAILVAFSDEEKALSANTQGFDSWRKRMYPICRHAGIRILDFALAPVLSRLGNAVNGALDYGIRNAVFQRQAVIAM